jgi:hypothetical protein
MAELFRVWKKNLWQKYQQTNKVPTFKGHLSKHANNWKEFQKFKESENSKALSAKKKKNAVNKVYHHHLGPGGYETAMPKWDKQEQEIIARGIQPEPIRDEWELRARNWFLAHDVSYDEETGDLLCSVGLRVPRENRKRGAEISVPIERKTCSHWSSGMMNTEDEHEALALLTRGGLGLPKTKILTEAEREQRSDKRRSKMTS